MAGGKVEYLIDHIQYTMPPKIKRGNKQIKQEIDHVDKISNKLDDILKRLDKTNPMAKIKKVKSPKNKTKKGISK